MKTVEQKRDALARATRLRAKLADLFADLIRAELALDDPLRFDRVAKLAGHAKAVGQLSADRVDALVCRDRDVNENVGIVGGAVERGAARANNLFAGNFGGNDNEYPLRLIHGVRDDKNFIVAVSLTPRDGVQVDLPWQVVTVAVQMIMHPQPDSDVLIKQLKTATLVLRADGRAFGEFPLVAVPVRGGGVIIGEDGTIAGSTRTDSLVLYRPATGLITATCTEDVPYLVVLSLELSPG